MYLELCLESIKELFEKLVSLTIFAKRSITNV